MPTSFSMRQLLDAGVHYGHVTRKWNPKMASYIFGKRNGIHIIDLEQTVPMLETALNVVEEVISNYGRVLFVGTKPQATEKVKEAAQKCGQYYVNHRWLGGMLTNWKTINQSMKRLKGLEEQIANPIGLTKKEILQLQREQEKLELALGGIREMGGLPDLIIVIDTIREAIAVKEAVKLGIPIVAIVDSNSCPDEITYPIPGNDDATKAIELYCDLFTSAILEGLQKGMKKSGVDLGSSDTILEKIAEENNDAAKMLEGSEVIESETGVQGEVINNATDEKRENKD
ncbi:MAG: 30S ribosomal protein S2 [Holosporales bacterium]|nr:30S ribosomal protein S2 [Holosporales bacterium]